VANGATGYLHKDVSREELCAAVASALDGRDLLEPSLRRAMAERAGGARVVDPMGGLTERELQVLRLLDSDLSAPEIARELFVSYNTVRTHTKHIFTKLDVSTRPAAVRRARERGLM